MFDCCWIYIFLQTLQVGGSKSDGGRMGPPPEVPKPQTPTRGSNWQPWKRQIWLCLSLFVSDYKWRKNETKLILLLIQLLESKWFPWEIKVKRIVNRTSVINKKIKVQVYRCSELSVNMKTKYENFSSKNQIVNVHFIMIHSGDDININTYLFNSFKKCWMVQILFWTLIQIKKV